MMQLKDKLDLSFVESKRKTLFKVAGMLAQVLLPGAAFFLFFFLAAQLRIFSISGSVPASLVTAMYSLVFLLSVVTGTVGLTNALYLTADNRVLLTLPAPSNVVFLSKFVLYYIFELKRNATLLLPMYVAYGIVCKAVWYFYPWVIVCYFLVSLLPVAISAVLSIPALYLSNFVRRHKWLQAVLILIATGLVGWGVFAAIGLIPENINFGGRWGVISESIQKALDTFAGWVLPLDKINLMIIGGTSEIKVNVFTMNALWGMLITLGTIAVCVGLTILIVRPLFFKMASSQFEFEKKTLAGRTNKVHKSKLSPLVYETLRSFRSSRFVLRQIVSLLILPIAVYFLNKTYAAMNTALTGQYMTVGFSMLVCLLIVTSDNVVYASVYSVDGAARPIAKTQPLNPRISLTVRLVPRAAVIFVSTVVAACLWQSVAGFTAYETMMLAFTVMFVGWAHLLWSAEMDIMRPQHDQYATVGLSFDNPNERNSTIVAFVMSVLVSFLMYFIMGEGQTKAITKIALLAIVFFAARVFLYFTRIRLYYAEK